MTGMRNGELYALRWHRVDLESRILYVQDNWTKKDGIGPTKGRYWRTVPINDQLHTFLSDLKRKSKGGFRKKVWTWKSQRRIEKKHKLYTDF